MAIPDFLKYAQATPTGGFQSAIQSGLRTFGGVRALAEQRAKARREEEMQPLKMEVLKAQAALAKQKATPLGAASTVGGDVGQRLAIERLKKAGTSPEVIKDMEDMYHATISSKQQRATYFGLPQIAKLHKYSETIGKPAGAPSIGTTPDLAQKRALFDKAHVAPDAYTPDEKRKLRQVHAAEQKATSDPGTRQQVGAVNEIIDQYQSVPYQDIKQFAGDPIMQHWEAMKASPYMQKMGFRESPAFRAFSVFQKQAKGMADQLRKALGTSIRNQYVKTMLLPLIDNITNTWSTNPQIAEMQWQWFGNWMKSYRNAYTKMIEEGVPTKDIQKMDIVSANPQLQMSAPGYLKASDGRMYSIEELRQIRGRGR